METTARTQGTGRAAAVFDLSRGRQALPSVVRRPLARGDLTLQTSLPLVGGLAVVSGVCADLPAPVCMLFFAAAVALEGAYSALRSVTWIEAILSGVMVAFGGLAGWVAVTPLSPLSVGPGRPSPRCTQGVAAGLARARARETSATVVVFRHGAA